MNSEVPKQPRVLELDGIRGLAIALVLFEHFVGRSITGSGWLANALQMSRLFGATGVDLFFVLSGFLIGGILMDHRQTENYFKSFYVRRCCRILPAYLLTLTVYLALKLLLTSYASEAWFKGLFFQGGMPSWAYFTFAQNIVKAATFHVNADWMIVTWSLVVEEQFYLVLPLALWLCRPSRVVKIALVLICLNPMIQLFLRIQNPVAYDAVANVLPVRGDALLVGLICACCLRQNRIESWLAQNLRLLGAVLIVLLLGMFAMTPMYGRGAYEYERILFFDVWLGLFYGGLLLVAVTNKAGVVSAAMRWPLLRRLGAISYGVYLFHVPINGLLHGFLLGKDTSYRSPADALVTILALAVTLLFSTASWHFFEKPVIAWGHSFLYGKPKI